MKRAVVSPREIGNIKSEDSNYYPSIIFSHGEKGDV